MQSEVVLYGTNGICIYILKAGSSPVGLQAKEGIVH